MSRLIVLSLVVLAGVAAGRVPSSATQLRDVDGVRRDLFTPSGAASVLLFVSSDCPISNGYAPEIQRVCAEYRTRGVSCTLLYEDASIDVAAARSHRQAFGYGDMPAVVDTAHAIAAAARATVTPQAVVVVAGGEVGCHTRSHARLSAISGDDARLRDEIVAAKARIEAEIGTPCRSFAWPYGKMGDIDAKALAAIEEAGFDITFSAVRGRVTPGSTSLMKVPRHQVEFHWPLWENLLWAGGCRE